MQIADALMQALHPAGVGGSHRGEASLHDDARRRKAKLGHENIMLARHIQRGRAHTFRVPLTAGRNIDFQVCAPSGVALR